MRITFPIINDKPITNRVIIVVHKNSIEGLTLFTKKAPKKLRFKGKRK